MNPEEYPAMFRIEKDHWWYRGLRDLVLRWVKKVQPTDILDAGCGTGMVMAELTEQGYRVQGIDLSPIAIDFCHQRGLAQAQVGRMEKLSQADASLDLITALDVLGPLTDDEVSRALDEFHRTLRPGGHVICNVAALRWLFSTHDQACNWRRRYHRYELKVLFERHGFEIKFLTFRLFLLFPLVALTKLLEKRHMTSDIRKSHGDLEKTSPLMNTLLYPVMWLENWILRYSSLPWGSSLFVVAQKK